MGSINYTGGLYYGVDATQRGIPTDDIRDNAVVENKIAENAVTNRQIADNSISGAKLLDLSITGNKLANATIEAAKLAFNPYKFVYVADENGVVRFQAENITDIIQFAGNAVTFDVANKRVIITQIPGPQGPQGPTGATGATGPQGPAGIAYIYYDAVRAWRSIDRVRAESGLYGRESGGHGYIGIADGGVTSAKIRNRTIRSEDIDREQVTSYEIANYTIRGEDIGSRTIDASKLVWDTITLTSRTGVEVGGYFWPQGITWWGWTWWWYYPGRIPMFFGKASGSSGDTYNLSDFATRVDTTSWGIKNIVLEWHWGWPWEWGWRDTWRTVRIVTLNHHSEPPEGMMESKFYLEYDNTHGWIMSITKSEVTGAFYHPDVLTHNTGLYPIDNHPERDEIFNNPSRYVVDLEKLQVRKMTAEEEEKHFAWVQARATEAGLQPPENVELDNIEKIYTVRQE